MRRPNAEWDGDWDDEDGWSEQPASPSWSQPATQKPNGCGMSPHIASPSAFGSQDVRRSGCRPRLLSRAGLLCACALMAACYMFSFRYGGGRRAGVGASAALLSSMGFDVLAVEPSSAASAAVAEAGVRVLRAVVGAQKEVVDFI